MLESLLPKDIVEALENINISKLCELRLRVNMPICINILGESYYLASYGICNSKSNAIICKKSHIDYIIQIASNNSLYTINDQLVNGYISYLGGIRIGVAGEFVYVNDQIKTIKNIQALNIRIPHEVFGCSLSGFQYIQKGKSIYNTLILSPAGAGKTTYIRDLAKQLLNKFQMLNVLIVDERCEITGIANGKANFSDFNCDILSNCKKEYAFDNGIRSLKPDVIITDELSQEDIKSVENAITCGVKVVATIHADSIMDLKNKPKFIDILQKKLFDRYIILSANNRPGEFVGVYDAELECIAL